jgi:hypothetical protein
VRSLFLTIFLILAPMVVFCIFVARHLINDFPDHWGVSVMVIVIVFTVYVSVVVLSELIQVILLKLFCIWFFHMIIWQLNHVLLLENWMFWINTNYGSVQQANCYMGWSNLFMLAR